MSDLQGPDLLMPTATEHDEIARRVKGLERQVRALVAVVVLCVMLFGVGGLLLANVQRVVLDQRAARAKAINDGFCLALRYIPPSSVKTDLRGVFKCTGPAGPPAKSHARGSRGLP